VPPVAAPPAAIPPLEVPPALPVEAPPPVELTPELEEFLPPGMSPTLLRHPVVADPDAAMKTSPTGANIRANVDGCPTRVRAR
jgi:hypothetical protein